MFNPFDTIPAVTDSQLPRHVAVANTRYAIASRLKMESKTYWELKPKAHGHSRRHHISNAKVQSRSCKGWVNKSKLMEERRPIIGYALTECVQCVRYAAWICVVLQRIAAEGGDCRMLSCGRKVWWPHIKAIRWPLLATWSASMTLKATPRKLWQVRRLVTSKEELMMNWRWKTTWLHSDGKRHTQSNYLPKAVITGQIYRWHFPVGK